MNEKQNEELSQNLLMNGNPYFRKSSTTHHGDFSAQVPFPMID